MIYEKYMASQNASSGRGIGEGKVTTSDFRLVPSQWETVLLCNNISHWLGTSLESAVVKIRVRIYELQKHYIESKQKIIMV